MVDGSKDEFSKQFTCPINRIDSKERPDLHWSDLETASKPPKDIAADPDRLRMWQEKNAQSKAYEDSNYTILELTGCGKHLLYGCRRIKSGNRFSCWEKPFPSASSATTAPSAPSASAGPSASVSSGGTSGGTSGSTLALTLATLAAAPLTSIPTPLLPPPITGTYEAFDVVHNFEWASSIGASWSPDAKLYRIHAGHVPFDGKVDLASPESATSLDLYFNSRAKGDVDLQMEVSPVRDRRAGQPQTLEVSVSLHRDTTTRTPLPKPWCSVSRAVEPLRTSRLLASAKPESGLDATLLFVGSKPYWYMQCADAAGKGVAAYVTAFTCAIDHPQ
jgi:hypothetical protein